MADGSILAAILAGNDPQAAQMLQGYQGAQLQGASIDPNFGHNEGPFGALAKTIAGIRGSGMTNDAVQALTAARQSAQPDLARLLAGNDAFKAIADSPSGYNPSAVSRALAGANPGSVAEMRLKQAQAGLATNRIQPGPPMPSLYQGVDALSAASPRAKGSTGPLTMTAGPPVGGRMAPAPDLGIDLPSIATMEGPQQAQAIAKLNPQQRIALGSQIAKARALATQQRAATAQTASPQPMMAPSGAGAAGAGQP